MTEVIRAAGILFLDPEGNALFLRRAPGGDAVGQWAFPGGKLEGDETAEEAAIRETIEEAGHSVKPAALKPHTRRIKPVDIPNVPQPAPAEIGEQAPLAPVEIPPLPMVDFTTFLVRLPKQFTPTLDKENDGYVWSKVTEPPTPLHPGCRVALDKLFWNELDIARAMSIGELTSPQRYINMTMWAMRITGTGRSFRKNQKRKGDDGKTVTYDEHVYRPPENYLTKDFLDRCNGLPVIWEHPKKATLTSKEFANRIVGTTLLPYIEGDEVWGIVKIYDDEANEGLDNKQLSTSPTVVFTEISVNTSLALPDKSMLLIEGVPGLLDHLAICERGVWDKGGEPSGVSNDHITARGVSDVAEEKVKKEEKKEEDSAKKDEAGTDGSGKAVLDAVMDAMTKMADAMRQDNAAMCQKMDAKIDAIADSVKKMDSKKADESKEEKKEEKSDAKKADENKEEKKEEKSDSKKKDEDMAEETAADKKRKDSEKEEKKEDAVKSDSVPRSEFDKLMATVADLTKRQPRQLTAADRDAFADAQSKADAVLITHGERAEPPMVNEDIVAYNIRLARKMQPHSKTWKGVDLALIAADSLAFNIAMDGIRADALQAGINPVDMKPFEHRKIVEQSPGGHTITRFVGNGTIFKQLSRPVRHVGYIGTRDHSKN